MTRLLHLFFTSVFVLSGTVCVSASDKPTRIVRYLYDGNNAKKKITITSFDGGPAIASVSIQSPTEKKEITGEIAAATFQKFWDGFDSNPDLKKSDITNSKITVDTDTHHVFFTMEKTSARSVSKSYGVLAAGAGSEFMTWLRLLEPEKKKENLK